MATRKTARSTALRPSELTYPSQAVRRLLGWRAVPPPQFASNHDTGSQYNEPYRFYNLDVFEYDLDRPWLYGRAIPLHGPFHGPCSTDTDHRRAGVFYNNASETFVDVSDDSGALHFVSESGVLELFLFRTFESRRKASRTSQYAFTQRGPSGAASALRSRTTTSAAGTTRTRRTSTRCTPPLRGGGHTL